ncbi:hypothetical protein BAY61_09075 [Prauserella marina]|uniref:Uncharacterized protein n=1 Tax=Prauserella marina TaxID=530584 RepID=A0A222VMJ6_9PSEU|nr:DUF202 domain-containing protein [Prauserella marina]ASR35107.1 hypothetical protein BAY61_09075 [Prauserella marina]PWV85139.1 uncharacterized protein DUF202 [Prauserella marina]SDC03891.1 protein of unknown function [Prauserella marina]
MTEGLQPERTGLAWQRTALAAGACALLLLHSAAREGWGVLTVPAALAGVSALVLAVAGTYRDRALRGSAEPPEAGAGLVAAVAVAVTATTTATLVTLML